MVFFGNEGIRFPRHSTQLFIFDDTCCLTSSHGNMNWVACCEWVLFQGRIAADLLI